MNKSYFKPLCIYHRNCIDGFAAAWVVGFRLGFDNVEFLAAEYGDAVPDLTNREVYIVDFSYKPEELLPHLSKALCTVIIDHHASAADLWTDEVKAKAHPTFFFHYDNTKSGAVLTWEYFRGHEIPKLPKLLAYCQDHDLHKFELPRSQEVSAELYAMPMIREQDFAVFSEMVDMFEEHEAYFETVADRGAAVLQYQKTLISGMIERGVQYVEFDGWQNIPCLAVSQEMHTLAGAILAKGYPFAITFEDFRARGKRPGYRKYSLRSDKNSPTSADVKAICVKHGGGGHRHAAGFSKPLLEVGPAGENTTVRRQFDSPLPHWTSIKGWTLDANEIAKGGLLRVMSNTTKRYLFDIRVPSINDYVDVGHKAITRLCYGDLRKGTPRAVVNEVVYSMDFMSPEFQGDPLHRIIGTLYADLDTETTTQKRSIPTTIL